MRRRRAKRVSSYFRIKIAGYVCIAASVLIVVLIGVILGERFVREPVEVAGRIEKAGVHRNLGVPRVAAVNPMAVFFTIEPHLTDSRYPVIFGYQPSLWPTDKAKELAATLTAGTRVVITVDRKQLEEAKNHVVARHRLEQGGGIYDPPWTGEPDDVQIIKLTSSGDVIIGEWDDIWRFGFIAGFLMIGTLMFGIVGLAMVREDI